MNRLQAVADQPGLWQNQDWIPGTPGAFVILIGVSSYAHLAGGSGVAAPTNYGLGQLYVSAYTAYGLFNWFNRQYQFTPTNEQDCPIAQCWLLLAPTPEELTGMDSQVRNHLLAPTSANIRMATRRWQTTMATLPRVVAEQSRSYFFFSGHGLEIYQDEQLLLPTDWLNPDGREDDAINIRRLAKALSQLAIGDQYFFVDACRNDSPSLRRLVIRGDGLLTEGQSFMVNGACNGPILCASSAGIETFQPRHIRDGYSLFGQALLDGLSGREGFRPDCEPSLCAVKFYPLHEFVINRYNQLLRQFGEGRTHAIPLTGQLTKPTGVVTHLLPAGTPSAAPQSVKEGQEQAFTTRLAIDLDLRLNFTGETFQFLNRSHPDYGYVAGASHQSFAGETIQDSPQVRTSNRNSLFLSAQDVFAQDSVTDFWESRRLHSLETRKWVNPLQVVLHRVERTGNDRSYRLTLSLPKLPGRHWLEFDFARFTYAFALPGDVLAQDFHPYGAQNPVYYTIEFTTTQSTSDRPARLRNATASLSPYNQTWAIQQLVPIWEKYTSGLAIQALQELEAEQLQRIVIEKADSPIAAMMATLILLRAGRTDLIEPGWMANLKNWFPQRPDGPIIENEYWLRRNASDTSIFQLIENVEEMNRRGLPYLNEVVGYAIRQVDDLLGLERLPRSQRSMLLRTQQRFQRVLRYFQSGGLFSSFEGRRRDQGLNPTLLMMPRLNRP